MDDSHGIATLATIQASLTALSVQAGRTDERLQGIAAALTKHMLEEHAAFTDALRKVERLEQSIAEIHSVAKFTRILAAIVASLAGVAAWALDLFKVRP